MTTPKASCVIQDGVIHKVNIKFNFLKVYHTMLCQSLTIINCEIVLNMLITPCCNAKIAGNHREKCRKAWAITRKLLYLVISKESEFISMDISWYIKGLGYVAWTWHSIGNDTQIGLRTLLKYSTLRPTLVIFRYLKLTHIL